MFLIGLFGNVAVHLYFLMKSSCHSFKLCLKRRGKCKCCFKNEINSQQQSKYIDKKESDAQADKKLVEVVLATDKKVKA